jgi:hypothetical protein
MVGRGEEGPQQEMRGQTMKGLQCGPLTPCTGVNVGATLRVVVGHTPQGVAHGGTPVKAAAGHTRAPHLDQQAQQLLPLDNRGLPVGPDYSRVPQLLMAAHLLGSLAGLLPGSEQAGCTMRWSGPMR